jgi:hypothetical protein
VLLQLCLAVLRNENNSGRNEGDQSKQSLENGEGRRIKRHPTHCWRLNLAVDPHSDESHNSNQVSRATNKATDSLPPALRRARLLPLTPLQGDDTLDIVFDVLGTMRGARR